MNRAGPASPYRDWDSANVGDFLTHFFLRPRSASICHQLALAGWLFARRSPSVYRKTIVAVALGISDAQTVFPMKRIFGLALIPLNVDLGLLFFRVVLALLVLRFHGWGKLAGWKDEPAHLPNLFALDGWRKEFHTFPNYIGISSEVSYLLVTWFETFGCLMIVAGLCTRFNALGMFVTLMIAWYFHHHMRFSGPNSGEVAFAYGFGFLLLFLAGAGKYSLDRKFGFQAFR